MGVTTTFTNKPINPRGNDASPLGYNRAALYSGKALDFDGVNDDITIPNSDSINITGDALTIAGYINTDGSTAWQGICYKDGGNNKGYQLFVDKSGDPNIAFGVHTGTFYRLYSNEVIENNKWYFVVATYDGVNQSIYINGAFDNSQAVTGNITNSSTENLYIGRNTAGSERFNGEIGGFKIFNTALTAAQVADLYNNPEKIVPTGVSNDALKLWLPMQEGAGTTAYDGSADLTDYVTNGDFSDGTNDWTASNATLSVEGGALKITSTGGNRPQGYQIITGLTIGRKYLLSAVARVGTTTYNMEIEISGIGASGSYNKTTNSTDTYIYTEFTATSTTHVVQAKIDDASVGVGETGYFDNIKLLDLGNYGTINGATWVQGVGAPVSQTAVIDWNKWYLDHTNEVLIPQGLTAGRDLLGNLFENVRKQGALNLDGNSWAEVHDNASLDFSSGMTLETWVQIDDADGINQHVLGKWNSGAGKKEYLIYYAHGANAVQFYFGHGTNVQSASFSITATGQWFHFVGTTDGSTITPYVNGVAGTTAAQTTALAASDIDVTIGTDDTKGISAVQKQLAQPRIYNRALTAAEVLQNYNSGKSIYTNS